LLPSPAWLNVTVHVPVPLFIVSVAVPLPPPEHAPEPAMTTGLPEAPPVAVTSKVVLNTALAGACKLTVMTWPAFCAVVLFVTSGAAP
jgi:hypothetical protein